MTELRVYLLVANLRPQFAAYMGTPTRARGYPPLEGSNSLIIEVAPGLAVDLLDFEAQGAEVSAVRRRVIVPDPAAPAERPVP